MARTKRIWRESQHPRDAKGRFSRRGGAAWIKRAAAELTSAADSAATRDAAGRPRISRAAKAGVVLQAHADGGRPSAVRVPQATVTQRPSPAGLAAFNAQRLPTPIKRAAPQPVGLAGFNAPDAPKKKSWKADAARRAALQQERAGEPMEMPTLAAAELNAREAAVRDMMRGGGVTGPVVTPEPVKTIPARAPRPAPGAAAFRAARAEEQAPQMAAMVAARTAPETAPVPGAENYAAMRRHTLLALARDAGVSIRGKTNTQIANELAAHDAKVKADRAARSTPPSAESRTPEKLQAHADRLEAEANEARAAGRMQEAWDKSGRAEKFRRSAEAARAVDTPRVNPQDGGMTSTTPRKQVPAAAKREALNPPLSPEQKAIYDKMLGTGDDKGLVQNPHARRIVEQMEAHGWELTAQDNMLRTVSFRAPDGRELHAQFLLGNKKPQFYAGQGIRRQDITFKAALAHVITPHLAEVQGPNVGQAMRNVGLPGLYGQGWHDRDLAQRDPSYRPLADVARDMASPVGGGGTPKLTLAEGVARLRQAAEINRKVADDRKRYNDMVFGGNSVEDQHAITQRQRADEFERVADEMEKMAERRAAYEAERDRRAALPPDIRPGRSTPKPKAVKKAAPAPVEAPTPAPAPPAPRRLQTFADRMAGDMSQADILAAHLRNEEERQKLRAREAERARQIEEARANDTRSEREKLEEQLQQDRTVRDIGYRSGRSDPKREARIKAAEARLEEIRIDERKAQIKDYRKGDKVKTTYNDETIEVEVVGKTKDGYLRVLLPNGKRGNLNPKFIEGTTPAPKAEAAREAAPVRGRISQDAKRGAIANAREADTAAKRSASLEKARQTQRDERRALLNRTKDPKDNSAKIKALEDGTLDSADLYRTAMAGPSGQRAPVHVGRVRHTPDRPEGEFEVTSANGGDRAGWATRVSRNGETVYAVHSENADGGTELLGWADTLAHAADVLTNGEAAASTGGTLDARRISGRMFERNPNRNKSLEQLDREALDREIAQTREYLAKPELMPTLRARAERRLANLEAERRGEPETSVDTPRVKSQNGGMTTTTNAPAKPKSKLAPTIDAAVRVAVEMEEKLGPPPKQQPHGIVYGSPEWDAAEPIRAETGRYRTAAHNLQRTSGHPKPGLGRDKARELGLIEWDPATGYDRPTEAGRQHVATTSPAGPVKKAKKPEAGTVVQSTGDRPRTGTYTGDIQANRAERLNNKEFTDHVKTLTLTVNHTDDVRAHGFDTSDRPVQVGDEVMVHTFDRFRRGIVTQTTRGGASNGTTRIAYATPTGGYAQETTTPTAHVYQLVDPSRRPRENRAALLPRIEPEARPRRMSEEDRAAAAEARKTAEKAAAAKRRQDFFDSKINGITEALENPNGLGVNPPEWYLQMTTEEGLISLAKHLKVKVPNREQGPYGPKSRTREQVDAIRRSIIDAIRARSAEGKA